MQTLTFIVSVLCGLISVGLPLFMAKKLTPKTYPITPALSVFISMLCAFIVCWCQYYSDVIWIKSEDWSALQDVSETMAYSLLMFIAIVIGANGWLLKRLKTVL